MQDVDVRGFRTRVKGRPALERRLMRLLIAIHRFGRCRAATPADLVWTAKAIDGLTATHTALCGSGTEAR
jgi:hypothetical protein